MMPKTDDIAVKAYTDSPSYWAVPPMWKNKTVFIIGGGPSLQLMAGIDIHDLNNKRVFRLLREYFLPLLKNKRVIGTNSAFKLGADIIDICWFTDKGFFNREKAEMRNFKGLKVHCCNKWGVKFGCKRLKRSQAIYGIHTESTDTVRWNSNTGGSAINLAYHLGVKKIVLIGFDMQKIAARNNYHTEHAHGGYCDKGGYPKDWNPYPRFLPGFEMAAKQSKELGLEIVNATANSALDMFPIVKLEDVLND